MLNRARFLKFLAFMLAALMIAIPLFPTPAQAAGFCDTVSEIPTLECEALVALYNSTNGAHWTNHTNWLVTSTPCDWVYVACDTGHVAHLFLGNNNLSGTIPSQLRDLASLQDLYLGTNHLTGGIPSQLGSLSNLLNLDLFGNQLTGSIPMQLGDLSNLVSLGLGSNNLIDNIPDHLGDLLNLKFLYLGANNFSGGIPTHFDNLLSLQVLNCFKCQVTGSIPDGLGDLSNLQYLELGFNHLNGTIPFQLGGLTNLQHLILDHNQLTNAIPDQLGSLSNLLELDLGSNQLSHDIPPTLANLTNLQDLRLEFNMLTASDPTLITWLNSKQANWASSQTVPPTNVQAAPLSSTSMQVSWTPIDYSGNGGDYEVGYSNSISGPFDPVSCVTANKFASTCEIDNLTATTSYYFAVRTFTPAHDLQQNALTSLFSAAVSGTTPTPPVNDDFANAIVIDTGFAAFSDTQNVLGASYESGEPPATCGGNPAFRTVWYQYTALDSGFLNLTTIDSTYDTVLSVFTGAGLGSLGQVGCSDNSPPPYTTSTLTLMTTPGITYYIRVGSHSGVDTQLILDATVTSQASEPPLRDYLRTSTPKLSWNRVSWATGYRVQVSTSASFSMSIPLVYAVDLPDNFFSITTVALPQGVYYWRVSPDHGLTWSAVTRIVINPP